MVKSNVTKSIKPSELLDTLNSLQNDFEFSLGVTSIHYPPQIKVIYNLISLKHPYICKVSVNVPDNDPKIPSSYKIFPSNIAHEREVYDLMGVIFIDNPNLTRILLPSSFKGHPLRKDYI
jgi:NADH-quinone oxidoreductase subunit C